MMTTASATNNDIQATSRQPVDDAAPHLLVIDDDRKLCRLLGDYLTKNLSLRTNWFQIYICYKKISHH